MKILATQLRPAIRSLQNGIRCLSFGPVPQARIVQIDAHPEPDQYATLAQQREQEWKDYRRSKNWRRVRNLAFVSLGFLPVYLLLHPPDDERLTKAIEQDLARIPQVRKLVDDAATMPLRQIHAEISLDKRISSSLADETLNSPSLLGPRRAFWSHSQKELLQFQWFGVLLNGWPSVAHGGAIATVMSEAMSRAAVCMEPTAEPLPEPSSLSLTYLKPTLVRSFYLIRVKPLDTTTTPNIGPSLPPLGSSLDQEAHEIGPHKDLTTRPLPSEPPANDDDYTQLEATLERLDGKVLVKARASFPRRRPGSPEQT